MHFEYSCRSRVTIVLPDVDFPTRTLSAASKAEYRLDQSHGLSWSKGSTQNDVVVISSATKELKADHVGTSVGDKMFTDFTKK